MVFTAFLFLLTIIIILVNLVLSKIILHTLNRSPITFSKVLNELASPTLRTPHANFFLFLFILYVFSFNTPIFYFMGVLSSIVVTYLQFFVWSFTMEQLLTTMHYSVRKESLAQLLRENCIITQCTVHKYLHDLAKAGYASFTEFLQDSLEELKIAFYIIEPVEKVSEAQKQLYRLQKKYFKYKKVEEPKIRQYASDEAVWEEYAQWKVARDPKIMFNLVHRLPWVLTYDYKPKLFFKLAIQNTLVFYNFVKTVLLAVTLMFLYFLYTIFFFKIQFLKQLSVWFVIGMLYFWLMSGFNFFLKRYQYGKFTSQIQRFWKRTNTYFWLIEGFLLLIFFYYYLNSAQEPTYMYDYSALNQEYLISLHTIGTNVILLSLVIYFMYFTLLRINSNSWAQLNLYLMVISTFIFFSFFIETYQFYYVISTFNERVWLFNEEENLWGIDVDNPILRTKHQYLLVCLIAKYWHFLFIFLSWIFFLMKSFERRKITYVLFGANLQNMLILYALNFACYLQWFKWVYRRFFDLPYTWFMTNVDNKFVFRLFFEIKLLLANLYTLNVNGTTLPLVVYKSLNIWNVDSLAIWKFV